MSRLADRFSVSGQRPDLGVGAKRPPRGGGPGAVRAVRPGMLAVAISLIVLTSLPVAAQSTLGRPATPAEIAAWDIDVRPDGLGLPPGQGSVIKGEELFGDVCAACHGDFGEGLGLYPSLAGGEGTLSDPRPVKSIGSFVPYLSTIFDFVHRAKPFGDAQSYSDDEVYALVAYLLFLNDLVDEEFVLNPDSFTRISLPNEAGFIPDDRPQSELPLFSRDPCMQGCKSGVQIVSRAVPGVTPPPPDAP